MTLRDWGHGQRPHQLNRPRADVVVTRPRYSERTGSSHPQRPSPLVVFGMALARAAGVQNDGGAAEPAVHELCAMASQNVHLRPIIIVI